MAGFICPKCSNCSQIFKVLKKQNKTHFPLLLFLRLMLCVLAAAAAAFLLVLVVVVAVAVRCSLRCSCSGSGSGCRCVNVVRAFFVVAVVVFLFHSFL